MKTIQCAHPPHHHNGFVATCRLWTASGGVHALLVLEPTECSTSTRLGDYPMRPSSSSPQWLCGNMPAADGQWRSSRFVRVRTNRVLNKR